ncbi:23S rRNA (uridine(2552)-2'-O)-methyltransferase RlmE [Luminiphilus sp.]|jgi:23S rRNA (uridine2552-2'-O)-methyltransferase|nr:23S rRNA (uridine(2552)-2'-O)-methyltransferase RlmE [Luminiphilus sp.]MBT6351730.1 23S rRNA (uridine(2552)-2'-O)-methyltransferase RlmE [Halieaceae bacterium]MCH1579131.1 23S rRNA (uridine(2552)-2'-O)-methyltransferase RlmE [Luminiphilus sp.]MDA8619703.1 23S rRNA (uridine(2552)-2'-O)-methyltransferase RlmE [Luminiphilus sp.]MDB2365412.1 23S rRNA (uridine(2552)-2'-O)-methyltransferase RlmE [Luminiphilus sp.]
MGKKKSSSRAWLKEHHDDPFVQRAQREGYRSRAVYKLIEINEKDRLIQPGMSVLDLGSAPGGWSQVAGVLVGDRGRVLASDILPMDHLPNVTFIQGDFTEQETYDQLMQALSGRRLDVVISDMSPNMSGLAAVDQPRAMYLVELATDLALRALSPGGAMLTKVFQGEGFEEWFRQIRERFERVITRKPSASRPRSREVYVVATGLKVAKTAA